MIEQCTTKIFSQSCLFSFHNEKAMKTLKRLSFYTFILFVLQCLAAFGHSLFIQNISLISENIPSSIFTSKVIVQGWLHFLAAQLLCYTILILLLCWMAKVLGEVFQKEELKLAVRLWLFAILTIYIANQVIFPYSLFSFFAHWLPWDILLYALLVTWVLVVASFIYGCVKIYGTLKTLIALVILALLFVWPFSKKLPITTSIKPNIIIIGIDAVRPDYLHYMPHVNAFMQQATYFDNTVTPLARTFPAWTSILTGDYPKQTGARYDLPRFEDLTLSDDLPRILRKQGYYSVYSIDERLFNNIDVDHYGLDQFIGPGIGFNDFLLSSINDFPLTNLLVNTKLGKYLFPYSYANRSAYVTYQPQSFVKEISDELPSKQPLFFAAHLCLPHWNWLWAGAPQVGQTDEVKATQAAYRYSLQAADEQFNELMTVLKQKGLLKNAIVVVLSDHGQSFELKQDLLISKENYQAGDLTTKQIQRLTKPEVGHGTSLLSSQQYQAILGFKRYGAKPFADQMVDDRVGLVDIKATLLSLLNLSNNKNSLKCYLYLENCHHVATYFMETGFTLPGILNSKRSLKTVLGQGLSYFDLNPRTGRVYIKPALGELIIAGKQRSVLQGDWMLVYYPIPKHTPLWLLVNVTTGQWSDDLTGSFASKAPVKQLTQQMKNFYGNELPTN